MGITIARFSPIVDCPIVGDSVQPSTELAFEVELLEPLVNRQEGFLGHFLRLSLKGRPQNRDRQAKGLLLVAGDKLGKVFRASRTNVLTQ